MEGHRRKGRRRYDGAFRRDAVAWIGEGRRTRGDPRAGSWEPPSGAWPDSVPKVLQKEGAMVGGWKVQTTNRKEDEP